MNCIIAAEGASSYRPVTRPLRLRGHATSIRLESAYWQILEEIARQEGMSLAQLTAVLNDEMCEHGGDITNFASYLRVTCLHYVSKRDAYSAAEKAAEARVIRVPSRRGPASPYVGADGQRAHR